MKNVTRSPPLHLVKTSYCKDKKKNKNNPAWLVRLLCCVRLLGERNVALRCTISLRKKARWSSALASWLAVAALLCAALRCVALLCVWLTLGTAEDHVIKHAAYNHSCGRQAGREQ